MEKKINCLDLEIQHKSIKSEIFEAFEKVYDKTAFSGGAFVEEFEKSYSAYIGSNYTIGLSNGTVALHLAMLALGIGEGDEVIIPANTFIATPWGPSHAGAIPVFVDCDADTWQIDIKKIQTAITSKTKAIIGVHLYGQPCDIDSIKDLESYLFPIQTRSQTKNQDIVLENFNISEEQKKDNNIRSIFNLLNIAKNNFKQSD
jgi:dTDP-4-amino-4,6-dideoxygalactose transaminase